MEHYEATLLFFSGFYETWAGDLCSAQDSDIEYIKEQMDSAETHWIDEGLHADFKHYVKDDDKEAFIESVCEEYVWGYKHEEAQLAYCNEYAQKVCSLLQIPYLGMEMTSPNYYNYTTDKIHAEISGETLQTWVSRLQSDYALQGIFADIIKERCTSCSGFISSHSNELDDYLELDLDDWDNIKAGLLLEAVLYLDCPDNMGDSRFYMIPFVDNLHEDLLDNGFSDAYAADINKILDKKLSEYQDKNPDDDYIKPLPAKYLKGEVVVPASKGV